MRQRLMIIEFLILEARAEGNCGRATDRGEEACEFAVKLTPRRGIVCFSICSAPLRRQPHSQRNCEVTNRNHIQGRIEQASVPCNAKPSSSTRSGKCGTCAVKPQQLIQGDLIDVPEGKLASSRGVASQVATRRSEVSRWHSTLPHTPLRKGRPER